MDLFHAVFVDHYVKETLRLMLDVCVMFERGKRILLQCFHIVQQAMVALFMQQHEDVKLRCSNWRWN